MIEELKNRIQVLLLELSNAQRNGSSKGNNDDKKLKIELFYLLIQKYIDKNIIFDKREFLNILLKKKFKQNNNMNFRNFNIVNNRNYRTEDDSLKKFFKSKSKEKKYELLRDSYKNEQPY